jgi:hypothetical protein
MIEARRYAMRASIWIGWAGTLAMAAFVRSDWPGGSYESALPLSFSMMILGVYIAGARTGSLDVDTDLPPLADEAALDRDDRRAARLFGLAMPVGLALVTTLGIAVASRLEGGFWLGEGPRRTDSALHSPLELLQPALVVALAGALGVVSGSKFRRPLIAIVTGAFTWFVLFPVYWIWNTPPLNSLVPLQIMPLRVDLPDVVTMSDAPVGWYVEYPNEYSKVYVRDLVHTPTIAFHIVYLVGLIMVVAASAARAHRRAVRTSGLLILVAGVVAQLAVSPFGWTG